MLRRIHARPSSAHLLAAAALFVALGGTAVAVNKDRVGTKQLKPSAVTTKKLANGAVSTPKIAAGAVTGEQVDEATLGKVPSAARADEATRAANSASALDSAALEGRALSQVRGFAAATTKTTDTELSDLQAAEVASQSVDVPIGGAGLIATATVEILNNTMGPRSAGCALSADSEQMTQFYEVRSSDLSDPAALSLTGFVSVPNATKLPVATSVVLLCQGSGSDGDMVARNADLVVQVLPVG